MRTPRDPQPAPRRGGMAVAVLEAPPQHERVPDTRHSAFWMTYRKPTCCLLLITANPLYLAI